MPRPELALIAAVRRHPLARLGLCGAESPWEYPSAPKGRTGGPAVRALLERRLPELILRLTDAIRFDAPRLPSAEELQAELVAGDRDAVAIVVAQLSEESQEMNVRCGTAAPASSFILVIAAVLKESLDASVPIYVLLLLLAGFALFWAITGLSVRVGRSVVGLPPDVTDLEPMLVALRRKEAFARLASGCAGLALAALGLAALISALG